MANLRIKDLGSTATSMPSDSYVAIDSASGGTEKMSRASLRQDVADALAASPGTYNLAPLVGGTVEVAKGGTGSTTAAGARTNLSVNSIDESAAATGTKLVGPALYFDGVNDYIEFADDGKWSFTDGTDDLPFSVSAWVNMGDASNFGIAAKYGTSSANREWLFYLDGSDKLVLILHDGTNTTKVVSDDALTSYQGSWVHVAVTFGGAGPNSASPFSAAMTSNAVLYINGKTEASTATDNASYIGMANTSQNVWVGRWSSSYSKGHIKEVKVYNRSLTAAEVVKAMTGDLGFSEEWGDHTTNTVTDGGFENWATASDLTSWNEGSAITVAQESVDVLNGTYSLKLTGGGYISSTSNNWFYQNGVVSVGKRYRVSISAKRVSGSTDSLQLGVKYTEFLRFSGTTFSVYNGATLLSQTSLGSGWYNAVVEFVAPSGSSSEFVLGVNGATDPFLVDTVTCVKIGTLADLRAEDFNSSSGKWLDRSTNNFVGVNNGATLVGKRRHISAATLNLTSLPTSSAGLSAGEVWNNSGVLSIV